MKTLHLNRAVNYLAACFLILAGCSSGPAKAPSSTPAVPSAKTGPEASGAAGAPSVDAILDRYNLVDLNQAAQILTLSLEGHDFLSCFKSNEQTRLNLGKLKPLIAAQTKRDRDYYQADWRAYSKERGFDSCASHCACGVLAEVVAGASENAIQDPVEGMNSKLLKKLQTKAKFEDHLALTECSQRRAEWYCASELRSYLEAP